MLEIWQDLLNAEYSLAAFCCRCRCCRCRCRLPTNGHLFLAILSVLGMTEREREKEKERECDLSPNLSTAKWPLLLQALCQVVYLKALKRPSKLLLFLRAKLGRGKGGQHHILTALANSSSCPTKKNVVHPCRREREREWLTDSVTLEKVFVNFFKWTWRFPILYLPTLWGIERLLVRQTRVVDGLVPVVQTSI